MVKSDVLKSKTGKNKRSQGKLVNPEFFYVMKFDIRV